MRSKLLAVIVLASACGGDSPATQRLDGGFVLTDAAEFAPAITSFRASPVQVTAGVATEVTWTWTYEVEPTFPTPTCTIDNGVGTVTNGQTTMVTLTQVTLFTLTCTNSQGSTSRQTVVGVPPVAPQIATFTVSPTSVAPSTAQSYTFTWSYSNTPSPPPTCYVDGAGTSAVTSGMQISLTLPQARTFRLRCINGASGTAATADATVAVNECANAASYHCDPQASCVETTNGYSCACGSGYTGNGNTCNLLSASSSNCDANATWNGTACVCNAGYVGGGGTGDCTRARIAFVTSSGGTGLILNGSGAWAGGSGATGVAWADSVCAARATAQSLPGTYKAWISDSTDDAYCRIAGFAGKKSANCGQGALPTAAGPWVRMSSDRRPFAPTLDKLVAPSRTVYYPASFSEGGSQVTSSTKIWTGTTDTGEYSGVACNDWGSSSSALRGTTGLAHAGGSAWTKDTGSSLDPLCSSTASLLCMEVAAGTGPALPPRHAPGAKKAFLTSVSGTGNLTGWPDAHSVTGGYTTADEVCKSRARYAGYANSSTFKAWFTMYPYSITSSVRILTSGSAYARPDGVILGTTRSDMTDGTLAAAWNQTELNTYEPGNVDSGAAWTGMHYSGVYYTSSSFYSCQSWTTASASYYGILGKFGLTDTRATGTSSLETGTYAACDQTARLYCVED